MLLNSDIAWGRLFAESVAIIVSILLAFAIDAWWADRQDRVEETRILEALKAEFEGNARELPDRISNHQRSADSATALLEAIRPAVGSGPVSVKKYLVLYASDYGSFDPTRGAFDAMLQSDGLRYIRNPQIRQALADWPSYLDDATENEHLLRTIWGPRLLQEFSKLIDMGLMSDMQVCYDPAIDAACPETEIQIQPTLELIGSLEPVRSYTLEAARELKIVEEVAIDIAKLIEQDLQ